MEPRAGAPWEWQPLPKIRRKTKTRIKAKIKQKRESERRELIFGSLSFTTRAGCLTMLKNRGYIEFIFSVCFSDCSSCFCLGLLFLISFQEKRNQLPSDPLRAHDTLKLFPNILNIYGRVWICVHVCAVGKKGGQLCWKLSLPCALAPFILGSKPCVFVSVRVNVFECLCVFVENQADFRALGIKPQRSSSSPSLLHIYSIVSERKTLVCSEH